ncbi:sulfurtransferase TusA family protein [Martelella alba]|uniref:sulfurtransferase TusA family protein n=1 Tax=Martelella alba TaxID=2590451 RepID=UPI0038B2F272
MVTPGSVAPEILDLRGLKCPLPALKTKKRLAGLQPGALLIVITSDPLAVIDIPHLCREEGHCLLQQDRAEECDRFTIRRGLSPA